MCFPQFLHQMFLLTFSYGKFQTYESREHDILNSHTPIPDSVMITSQPVFIHLFHLLHASLSSFLLHWAIQKHSQIITEKAFHVERKVSTHTPGQSASSEEVYGGGMERMRGRLVGDEIRVTRQIDVTDTLCRSSQLVATALAFPPSKDFRAGGTISCGKLKLKRQRG